MFERLKTIFKGKDSGSASAKQRSGESVISKVTGVGPERKPVPLAPTGEAPASKATTPPPVGAATPPPMPERRPAPAAKSPAEAKAPPQKSPEDICAITPKMNKEEVRARLAFLYRRYNRATSSLDAKLRAEADEVLDAVVAVREKVFGSI